MSYLLAKQAKPFPESELIKTCLIAAAEEGRPENTKLFKMISLSARIAARRVKDTGNNIDGQFKNKAHDFGWFSFALHELAGVLMLFIKE